MRRKGMRGRLFLTGKSLSERWYTSFFLSANLDWFLWLRSLARGEHGNLFGLSSPTATQPHPNEIRTILKPCQVHFPKGAQCRRTRPIRRAGVQPSSSQGGVEGYGDCFGRKKEGPKELHGVERHGALPVAVSGVLPSEADFPIVKGDQRLVGNGCAVDIAGQVLEDLVSPSKDCSFPWKESLPRMRFSTACPFLVGR
jgi:hypothetical protein